MATDIERSGEPGILSKVLRVAAYPLAAVAAYWFGGTTVRNRAYDRLKRHKVFFDEQAGAKRIEQKIEIDQTVQAAIRDVANKRPVDLAEKIAPLDKKAAEEITAHMEKYGLDTLRKQWKFIHLSHKQEAVMQAFTAAGITLGALLTVAHSKAVSRVFVRQGTDKQQSDGPSV